MNGVQQKIFGYSTASKGRSTDNMSLLDDETRSLIPLSCYRKALDTVDAGGDEKVCSVNQGRNVELELN